MTSNFDWFLKKVYDRVDSLKDKDTGKWYGSFYIGDDSDNFADGSTDGGSGVLHGGNGNDTIIGGTPDFTEGGAGNDTLIGIGQNDQGVWLGNPYDERGDDTLIATNTNGIFCPGDGNNRIFMSGENNGRDTIRVFNISGNHGFTRVEGFNSEQDKIDLYLGTGDREFTFTTGIQSPSDTGNFFIRDNARGTSLMFQAEGSTTASRVMFFEGGANITADSFVGAEIS